MSCMANASMDPTIEDLKAQIRDLKAALGQRDEGLVTTFQLTQAPANLLGLLMAVPSATAATIQLKLGIVTDAKVAICRLRKDLASWAPKLGVAAGDIIRSKRGIGYWIEPDVKDRIRALVTPRPGERPAPAQAPIRSAGEPQPGTTAPAEGFA